MAVMKMMVTIVSTIKGRPARGAEKTVIGIIVITSARLSVGDGTRAEPRQLENHLTPTAERLSAAVVGLRMSRLRETTPTAIATAVARRLGPGGPREARLRPHGDINKVARQMMTAAAVPLSESVRPPRHSRQLGAVKLGTLAAARLRIEKIGTRAVLQTLALPGEHAQEFRPTGRLIDDPRLTLHVNIPPRTTVIQLSPILVNASWLNVPSRSTTRQIAVNRRRRQVTVMVVGHLLPRLVSPQVGPGAGTHVFGTVHTQTLPAAPATRDRKPLANVASVPAAIGSGPQTAAP